MGYRDDFYVVANIIGYSGRLDTHPTVYFLTNLEYGCITQTHGYSQNVGRNAVCSANGYTIGNEMVRGELKLLEKLNGVAFHESRSILTRVPQGDANTMAILAQSIWKYSDEKYISDYTPEDHEQIADSEDTLRAALTGLAGARAGLAHVPPSQMKGSGT